MNSSGRFDVEFERRMETALLDVMIRAGLIAAMVVLCYQVFSPFLHLTVWAIILAVALYPLHQAIAGRLGGRQGRRARVRVAGICRARMRVAGIGGRRGRAACGRPCCLYTDYLNDM